jgi:hypothetical protein
VKPSQCPVLGDFHGPETAGEDFCDLVAFQIGQAQLDYRALISWQLH